MVKTTAIERIIPFEILDKFPKDNFLFISNTHINFRTAK
jgi:hypothetical protein